MATLLVVRGPGEGRIYPVGEETTTIGRDAACSVRLEDNQVSRQHAEIRKDGPDHYLIRDLGSSNGTRLNDCRIAHWIKLRDGDEISLGQTLLRFCLRGAVSPPAGEEEVSSPDTVIQTLETQELPYLREDADEALKQEHLDRLRFLLRLSRAAVEADELPKLAAVLAEGLSKALAADRVLLLVGRDENMTPIERELPPHLRNVYKIPYSRTVVRQVARQRISVMSSLLQDDRFREAKSIKEARIASAICVPLLAGKELLGAIYLDRLEEVEPFGADDLELATAAGAHCAMAFLNLQRLQELRATRDGLEAELTGPAGFIGEAPSLRPVYDFIQRVAPTDAGVLILGESGTGKELVARAIHKASRRGDRPFVIVNCAALAESLAEAELFGHERGAFTGADRSRPGRFLAADGGTIFLDEVGELSETIQAKLLRVLESGEITPVGEAGVRHVDVRVIAATNRDLAAEVAKGCFRRDLYYRLNILRVELPPLRARLEDVPLLLEHFVRFFGQRCGRPNLKISAEAVDICRRYSWPGNVRELKNAVERMVILAKGSEIAAADLPAEITSDKAARATAGGDVYRTLAEVERDHILSLLRAVDGNKKRAAEILGIDRSTLYAKLKQYGIDTGKD